MAQQTKLSAEQITAIIFDPIPQERPRVKMDVMGILLRRKPAVIDTPPAAPEYRSLDDAFDHLADLGMAANNLGYLRRGVDALMGVTMRELEKSKPDFKRARDVSWDDGTAYLGLRIKSADSTELTEFCAESIAQARRTFMSDLTELMATSRRICEIDGLASTKPYTRRPAQTGVQHPAIA